MFCCFPCGDASERKDEQAPLMRANYWKTTNGSETIPKRLEIDDKSMEIVARNKDGASIPRLIVKPVKVPSVDKRFQDHSVLYKKYVDEYDELHKALIELNNFNAGHDFNDSLDANNSGKSSKKALKKLNSSNDLCFKRMKKLTENSTTVSLSRPQKYCVQIIYEGRDVTHDVIPALLVFNTAGRLVHNLIEKGPTLRGALQLVVDSSKELRRDVLAASLGADGPDSLKNCVDNVRSFESAIKSIEDLEDKTYLIFEQLKNCGI